MSQESPVGLVRRHVLAFALALLAGESFKFLSDDIDKVFPGAKLLENLAAWAVSRVPELAPLIPQNGELSGNGALLAVVLAVSLWLAHAEWLKRIDLVLFSPFDRKTLNPIPRRTGLLVWNLYQQADSGDWYTLTQETAQKKIWDGLGAWVRSGLGERRWGWFWRKPNLPLPFSWALLLGPNGMGKTQLACELGLSLAQSETRQRLASADRGERLQAWRALAAAWLRRCNCAARRLEDDAWDAALWPKTSNARNRLDGWRPRRPSFIVVDEPLERDWDIIEILERNSPEFCHPVRLLFIDQCRPPENLLKPYQGGQSAGVFGGEWHLHEFAFTRQNARPPKPWDETHDLPGDMPAAIYPTDNMARLLNLLDGNPVLVALGVRWLGKKGHRLVDLTETQAEAEEADLAKTQARHRLLDDRLQELLSSFRAERQFDANLARAIACATLANGVEFSQAQTIFRFSHTALDIAGLFPHYRQQGLLPPIKPAVVGDRFLVHPRHGLPALLGWATPEQILAGLAELVREAWQLNPAGMQRTLTRRSLRRVALDEAGKQQDLLGLALQTLPEAQTPEQAFQLARAFADVAIRQDGDLPSARAMLELALPRWTPAQTASFLAELARLGDSPDADALPLVCLYCQAAAHALEARPEDPALLDQILSALEQHLPHVGSRGYPVPGNDLALFDAFAALLATPALRQLGSGVGAAHGRDVSGDSSRDLPQPDSALVAGMARSYEYGQPPRGDRGLARLHRQLADPLVDIAWFLQQKLAVPLALRLSEAFPGGQSWQGILALLVAALDKDVERCQRIVAEGLKAAPDEEIELWTAYYRAFVHGGREDTEQCLQAAQQVEVISTEPSWITDSEAQCLRASAWAFLAYSYSGHKNADNIRGLIAKVDAIARLDGCLGQPRIQSSLANMWRNLAFDYSIQEDVDNTRLAVEQVESLFVQESLAKDRFRLWQIAHAYRDLAHVYAQKNDLEHTLEIVQRLEVIASRPNLEKIRLVQDNRATAWNHLAYVYSGLGDITQARQIAERLSTMLGGYWQNDPGLQERLAESWRRLAHAHNQKGENNKTGSADLAQILVAVAQVERISSQACWLEIQGLQFERICAWGELVEAYVKRLDGEKARWTLDKVEAICQAWPTNPISQAVRVHAWEALAKVYRTQGNLSELRQVMQQIGRITRHRIWRDEADIQSAHIRVWYFLVGVYHDRRNAVKTAWAVKRVETLAGRSCFRQHSGIQAMRAEAWQALASVHAQQGDIANTRCALAHTAAIARHWRQDSRLQLQLAKGYERLVWVCSRQRQLAPTRRALRKLEALSARYPADPRFSDLVDQAHQHLGSGMADIPNRTGWMPFPPGGGG